MNASSPPKNAPRNLPLGEQVYETLLSQLITLKIGPGSRISIDSLSRELNVSQTPIRAALIRLEAEGLVIKVHNIGYSAASMPSHQRFEEIYDIREMLEPYLASRAAQQLSDSDAMELCALADTMKIPAGEDLSLAYGKFAKLDAQFHAWIAERGNNHMAQEALTRLHAHVHLFRLRFHSRVTEEAIQEHDAIVTAILARAPEQAAAAMREHISRSRARMEPYFKMIE
ncbi:MULTISPECIES: GntR family transcriptional regulator [Pseudomonas]|uniref:GntR family transcriptional regulator n=1 Tax=Pseudomonas urmiensis TaxID=2745493 RepID=A0A923JWS3_9PSED|nr:GntR family transcriptional regulator [Pseudomonas urmiensis]HEN8731799.1 GntR family transcriptional regulator [Pseudomonas putida]